MHLNWQAKVSILFSALLAVPIDLTVAWAAYLPDLVLLTRDCFLTNERTTCRKALISAEIFQLYAASNGIYACQTRLLGLQNELLVVPVQSGHSKAAIEMLEEVEAFCEGL